MDAWLRRVLHCRPAGINVFAPGACQAADERAVLGADLLGDIANRLPVAGRRRREAGLDDIDLEPRQLPCDLQLLVARYRATGRLLAIAQGRVKNAYMIAHGSLLEIRRER